MKEKEKQLFKSLCKFKDKLPDNDLIQFATPSVLGHLFCNRMQGVAYGVLKKNGLISKINREFRNAISAAYYQNVQKNISFKKCVAMISQSMSLCNFKFAMLKGAYLCMHYPNGYRTSNDLDILTLPENVTQIGKLLTSLGFRQGSIQNNKFVPATREQIIVSKMMRGETVPYIKEVKLPFMRFFEVDINFSLDYKNGNEDILSNMLSRVCIKKEKGVSIPTLCNSDFFIHLCAHLYKEATTFPWLEMRRDMTLYKYCDIYLLLSEMDNKTIQKIFERATELGMNKICAYAILEAIELFDIDNPFAYNISNSILRQDPTFRFLITSPKDKKTFIYQTHDANKRFFMESRINDLTEIFTNEKA